MHSQLSIGISHTRLGLGGTRLGLLTDILIRPLVTLFSWCGRKRGKPSTRPRTAQLLEVQRAHSWTHQRSLDIHLITTHYEVLLMSVPTPLPSRHATFVEPVNQTTHPASPSPSLSPTFQLRLKAVMWQIQASLSGWVLLSLVLALP